MKELTQKQKARLKQHKVHHSDQHMKMMKAEMQKGKTFEQAHKNAQKKVGK